MGEHFAGGGGSVGSVVELRDGCNLFFYLKYSEEQGALGEVPK